MGFPFSNPSPFLTGVQSAMSNPQIPIPSCGPLCYYTPYKNGWAIYYISVKDAEEPWQIEMVYHAQSEQELNNWIEQESKAFQSHLTHSFDTAKPKDDE